MHLEIRHARPEDAAELVVVQSRAFLADFNHYGVCPGYGRSPEHMASDLENPRCHPYLILLDNEPIGDILAVDLENGQFYLGCTCVVPEHQGKGIDGPVMRFLMSEFPQAVQWTLETPADKTENLQFYAAHGFSKTGELIQQGVCIAQFEYVPPQGEAAQRLAASLTAEGAELLPWLSWLLQDFWALGTDPETVVQLLQQNSTLTSPCSVLDLGCGKGAVSIALAAALGATVRGVDLTPAFIHTAESKALTHGVNHLCVFHLGDAVRELVQAHDYDCVVLGAVGNLLDDWAATLQVLHGAVLPGGYVVLNDAYLPVGSNRTDGLYPTMVEWQSLFSACSLELICAEEDPGMTSYEQEMTWILNRAETLSTLMPHKRPLFEAYVQRQLSEYQELSDTFVGVTWLLRRPYDTAC